MKKELFTSNNQISTGVFHLLGILLLLTIAIPLPIFSVAQGSWTKKADFPGSGRYGATYFSIGTKGYIGVAIADSDFSIFDMWEWDQTTNVWTRKADYPGKSAGYGISFSIGTKGYLGGGYDRTTNGFTNEFWEFDPVTNSWTQKASFPDGLSSGSSFSIGSKGYIVSSQQGLWEWDQTTNVWTRKSDYPGEAYDVSFSIGNKGYIGLGYYWDGNRYTNEFWEWDQGTNIWTRKADFGGISRFEAVGFSIGSKGYIGTGMIDVNPNWNTINDLWEWDQTSDVWTKKTDFEGGTRYTANSFSIGNKGYIGLGATSTNSKYYQDFWEFDPSAITSLKEVVDENFSLYPNPASDYFTLNTSRTDKSDLTLNIYNVSGELINSGTFSYSQQKINIKELRNGLYIVEIRSKEGPERQKLIVQR